MTIGIYILNFKGTDKVYIGQSTVVESRIKKHVYLLKNSLHYNSRLMQAYKQFGIPEGTLLEECTATDLTAKEDSWIEEFDSFRDGLNMRTAKFTSNYGTKHSQSKFTEEQILGAFFLLIGEYVSAKEISAETGVSEGVISMLAGGKVHGWIQGRYPLEWQKLLSLVGTREAQCHSHGFTYPDLKDPLGNIHSNINNLKVFAKSYELPYSSLHKLCRGTRKIPLYGWELA